MKIGELLIEQGLITPEQLEQALTAQQQFGGKLGTNLVEHGFVSDIELALFLSKQLKMPAANHADFEQIAPAVIEIIPKELADQYRVIPLRMDKKLTVAISDPNDLNSLDELKFKTGKSITSVVAPEIWIVAALERYYQIPREARYIAIEDGQLEERITNIEASLSEVNALSLQGFVDRLLKTKTKEDVFGSLLDFLATYSPQVAVYVLRKNVISGGMLRGFPIHLNQFQKLEIPYESSFAFRSVLEDQKYYFGKLGSEGEDQKLVSVLKLPPQKNVGLWPISFRGKGVAIVLLLFETGDEKENQKLNEMFSVACAKAGYALELGALRKVISDIPQA